MYDHNLDLIMQVSKTKQKQENQKIRAARGCIQKY